MDLKKIKLKFLSKNINYQHVLKIINFQHNPYKYISLADVKVLSSRFEGNPNILLEIACLKKLIISTNCKVGPSEILQRRGVYYLMWVTLTHYIKFSKNLI